MLVKPNDSVAFKASEVMVIAVGDNHHSCMIARYSIALKGIAEVMVEYFPFLHVTPLRRLNYS